MIRNPSVQKKRVMSRSATCSLCLSKAKLCNKCRCCTVQFIAEIVGRGSKLKDMIDINHENRISNPFFGTSFSNNFDFQKFVEATDACDSAQYRTVVHMNTFPQSTSISARRFRVLAQIVFTIEIVASVTQSIFSDLHCYLYNVQCSGAILYE